MLNLVATTDKLQITTSAAVTVDAHASYLDYVTGETTTAPGRQNTAITTATTTDIVASPAASTTRNVKTLHIRNKHASASVVVTVIYDQNGTDFELYKATLLAGEAIEYVEGVGFFPMLSDVALVRTVALSGDQSNSTTTPTEVAGLSLTTGMGAFTFIYPIIYQATVVTTGIKLSVNHTGTVTSFGAYRMFGGTSGLNSDAAPDQNQVLAAAAVMNAFAARTKSTAGWGTTISVDTADSDMYEWIIGSMKVTVDGDIELWHGSEVAAQTTVKAGSSLILLRTGD